MKILTIANEKGGVGKTFTSTQFALYCALKFNLKVCFIDLDQQGNSSNVLTSQSYFKKSSIDSTDLLLGTEIPLEDHKNVVYCADARLSLLEKQGDKQHNIFADNFVKALDKLSSHYDLAIIDTNPNPDIRSTAALVSCTHLLSPIQLTKEPIDGISRLFERIEMIQAINNNLPDGFIGMLPNLLESGRFQQENGKQLIKLFGKLLIQVISVTPCVYLENDRTVPLIDNGNLKLKENYSYAAIKRHSGIAEAQALGLPIWEMPNQAEAWSEMKKAFYTILLRMNVERDFKLTTDHLSLIEELKALYGNSLNKVINQFFMMDNPKSLPGVSLEKIAILREIKSRVSLSYFRV